MNLKHQHVAVAVALLVLGNSAAIGSLLVERIRDRAQLPDHLQQGLRLDGLLFRIAD
jgi:predicted MFS family arabinose efflux permease